MVHDVRHVVLEFPQLGMLMLLMGSIANTDSSKESMSGITLRPQSVDPNNMKLRNAMAAELTYVYMQV